VDKGEVKGVGCKSDGQVRPRCGLEGARAVNPVAQHSGSLENHNLASAQDEIFLGLRVSSSPGVFLPDREFAEAADEQVFSAGQGIFDDTQNSFNYRPGFLLA